MGPQRIKVSPAQAAILFFAILFGVGVGAAVLPVAAIEYLRSLAGPALAYPAGIIGTLGIITLGCTVRRRVTDRWQQLDQDLLDTFLKHIPDNVYFKDINGRFARISSSMAAYCGLKSPSDAVNKSDADIFGPEHAGQALADEQEIIRTGQAVIAKEEMETWPDGHETWALTTKAPLRDRSGRIIGTMGISQNITDRKQAEMRIQHTAHHDSLTGLPNRRHFEENLARAIAFAKNGGNSMAVLLLNLDRFEYVNDSLGHFVGDRVLESLAERLKRCVRPGDIVARLDGDKFVIAIPNVTGSGDIERATRKLLEAIEEPFHIDDHSLQLTASIGISRFPENGENPQILMQFAGTAMCNAKKSGRGRFTFFSPDLTAASQKQQELEADLHGAWSRDEFVIQYQPIVESQSGEITAMEALLRWKHPHRGLISPDQFIPLLEELGLMAEAGRWVLRSACRQAVEWTVQGFPDIRIAVNISTQQIYEGDIVATVESVLRETGLDPRRLELELTEKRLIDDSEATISILNRLKQIGVSLSLDDFGTGWSSLSYLERLPIDRIKIDRAFVRDLATQPTAKAMVKGILGIATSLGFSSIAEGVETAEQQEFLKNLNCPEMQGFYLHRPMLPVEAAALLNSQVFEARHLPNGIGPKAAGLNAHSGSPTDMAQEAR